MKYIIDFKNTSNDSDIASYLGNNNCAVIAEWDNFDKIFLVETDNEPPTADIIERIVLDDVLKIKPLDIINVNPYLFTHADPNKEKIEANNSDTKDWWKVYSFTRPNFDSEVTTFSRKGKGLDVYIMDSGIMSSHPEFVGADIVNIYSVTPENFDDNKGHGTALASVIAGKTCGITDATLKIVKIFDPNHQTLQSELLNALDAIVADHQPNTVSIVNCSWIIEKNEWVEHKFSLLIDKGVYVLAAAGNQGTAIENVTPASMNEVITIGAYNQELKPCDFSNYTGSSEISVTTGAVNHGVLDGWAPGEQIWAASLNGGYGYVAGTSIATAIGSAILASNIADSFNESGILEPNYHNMKFQSDIYSGLGGFLFDRPDMLELNDPKYSNSKNKLATIFDKNTNPNGQQKDEFVGYCKVGESSVVTKIYENNFTKNVEFLDPLPNNFILTPEGLIWGSPTADEGPAAGELDKIYTVHFKRTNTDDSIDDCKMEIYVLSPDTEPDTYPVDHPINILLQAGCFTGMCIFTTTVQDPCVNTCAGNSFCCGGTKNNYNSCNCIGSDRRLKTNIKRIGTHKLGIGLYEYDINGKRTRGVMADEVLKVKPEAVVLGENGYYKVCYDMID